MAKNRNKVEEIQALKSRKEFETYWDIPHKLDSLQTCIEQLQKTKGVTKIELQKYIPVALVATMESFLRSTIAKLINHRQDYLINSKSIFEGNFDFDIFTQLHAKNITIGEILSHQLKFNKFEHIDNHFTTVIGEKFTNKLIQLTNKNIFSGFRGPQPNEFAPRYDKIVTDIKKVLEYRHIICHEMSNKLVIEEKEIGDMFDSVRRFIYQIYNYTYSIFYPDTLLTDDELIAKSQKNYKEAREKLDTILMYIKENPITSFEARLDLVKFNEAQAYWEKYIELYSESMYNSFGGIVYQSFYLDELTDLINDRAEDLEIEFLPLQ
jgi:hypothetical protein